jgi:PIN domain nuclease of toxin-antitoxin system
MAVYVTDTHPLIWYAGRKHNKLSKRVLQIFDKAWENQAFIYIPAPVLWEIAVLIKANQIELPIPFNQWAAALNQRQGFEITPLDTEIIMQAYTIRINDDPFDDTIVATALARDCKLITKDIRITEANVVEVYW